MYSLRLLPLNMVPTCKGHTLFKLQTTDVPLLTDETPAKACSGAEQVDHSL